MDGIAPVAPMGPKKRPFLFLPLLALAATCSAGDGAPAPTPAPPTAAEIAASVRFATTVTAVSETSVTFKDGAAETTLPIGPWTKLVGVERATEIPPGARIGIRLSADRKVVFVLNAAKGN